MEEAGAVIVIVLLVLGIAAGAYYFMHGGWSLPGVTHLVSEYNESGIVVVSQYITPSPGSVWELVQAPSGLMFVETQSKLVEDLTLTNTTLAGGDIIAPHLDDFYLNGSAWTTLANGNVTTTVYNYATLSVQTRIYDLSPSDADVHAIIWEGHGVAVGQYMWGLSSRYSKPALFLANASATYRLDGASVLTGTWHTLFASFGSGSASIYVDGNLDASGTYTITPVEPNRGAKIGAAYGVTHIFKGKIAYVAIWDTKLTPPSVENILDTKPLSMLDATFYNGTHYIDLVGTVVGTPYNVQRVAADHTWLWLVKNARNDGLIHFEYFPKGTIIEIRDKVTGAVYKYTIDGVANGAGLVEDYAISPPTNNSVDVIAHVPSERIRFKAPDGFIVRLTDSANGYQAELPVQNGMVTLAAGDKLELVAKAEEPLYLSLSQDDLSYYINIKKSDGSTADAYVWIYDASGNLIDYGVAKNGVYSLPKSPDLPNGIRVSAVLLDSGIYYHGEDTFKLTEPQQTVTPAPQGLDALMQNNTFIALAIAFAFAIIAAVIVAHARG